jgi:hypothetical protein
VQDRWYGEIEKMSARVWLLNAEGSKQELTGSARPRTALLGKERAVHARSITYHGRPANIDAGVEFVKNEVWPVLDQIEGCRGLSFMVNRETGQCIATSSWENEATMSASEERLRVIRDRGKEIISGSMQVDEWEIAVMHRTHHGECCRVSWLQGDLDAMTETFRLGILPDLERTPGFCSASLMVNGATGLGCATTAWAADDMRSRAASAADGEIVDVREFELAYAHLHVPELV